MVPCASGSLTADPHLVPFGDQPQVQRAQVAGFGDAEDAHPALLADGTCRCTGGFASSWQRSSTGSVRAQFADLLGDRRPAAARALEPRAAGAAACPTADWRASARARLPDARARGRSSSSGCAPKSRAEAAARADATPAAFIAWFEALEQHGPGQGDPLFRVARGATPTSSRCAGTCSRKRPARPGSTTSPPTRRSSCRPRSSSSSRAIIGTRWAAATPRACTGRCSSGWSKRSRSSRAIETTVWESLALANAMTAMATRRDYAWHALGALGVIELTAPGRSAAVAAGLKRLGVAGQGPALFRPARGARRQAQRGLERARRSRPRSPKTRAARGRSRKAR